MIDREFTKAERPISSNDCSPADGLGTGEESKPTLPVSANTQTFRVNNKFSDDKNRLLERLTTKNFEKHNEKAVKEMKKPHKI